MSRVPASEATRKRLKQIFEGCEDEQFTRSAVIKQAVRLMIVQCRRCAASRLG
jgi:hypothetical protein